MIVLALAAAAPARAGFTQHVLAEEPGYALVAVDLDGDGDVDLGYAPPNTGDYSVLEQVSPGVFAPPLALGPTSTSRSWRWRRSTATATATATSSRSTPSTTW